MVNKLILRGNRVVLPCSLQKPAIELAHKGPQGITKKKQLLRSKTGFPNLDLLTETFIKSCVPCQAVTKSNQRDPIISSHSYRP